MIVECKNCGRRLSSAERYCPSCGQKTNTHRITTEVLVEEIVHYFTHIEKNIFTLLAKLTIQPGVVAAEYIEGKRKKYFSPITFFLLVSGFLVITTSVAHTFRVPFESAQTGEESRSLLEYAITHKINWIYLFLTLLYPFLYRLFFIKRRLYYTEHLTASLYWQGYLLLIFQLFLVPLIYVHNTTGSVILSFWIYIGLQCLYYALAYTQLFYPHSFLRFLRNLLISIAVNFLVFCVAVSLIRLYYIIFIFA